MLSGQEVFGICAVSVEPSSLLSRADLQPSQQEGVYTLLTASADRYCGDKICYSSALQRTGCPVLFLIYRENSDEHTVFHNRGLIRTTLWPWRVSQTL